VHAEKGDGRLADDERRALEACPSTSVITIPGTGFFLRNEESERIAELVVEALGLDEGTSPPLHPRSAGGPDQAQY
jgi:hypothetical protein